MHVALRVLVALAVLLIAPGGNAAERLLLQSTTSTQNSGLYDYLLPLFEEETGVDVQVVAVGTGRAIRNARNGDADVLLVHSLADELEFVRDGFGIERHDLMYNDFVIVGPDDDPAGLMSATSVVEALHKLLASGVKFVSRGDDSGTHKRELELWKLTGADFHSENYLESGSGMGATLRLAIELRAYTLSDRATWTAFGAKRDATVVFENDPPLLNQYGIIIVNPEKHPHVNLAAAEQFQDWMLSPRGQALIGAFRVNDTQLFFPNAKDGG